jgi:hypothetical protein
MAAMVSGQSGSSFNCSRSETCRTGRHLWGHPCGLAESGRLAHRLLVERLLDGTLPVEIVDDLAEVPESAADLIGPPAVAVRE